MLYTKTINNNKTFLYLYKKGSCIVSKNIVIYVRPNNRCYNRLGITAGKKIGNAVCRNRAKRVIRQAYRETETLMPVGIDMIIVARADILKIKSTALTGYLQNQGVRKIKAAAFGEEK